MPGVLTEFLEILGGGIATLGSSIASGVNSTVTGLFLDTSGETTALSHFGGIVAIFGAIALAVGLTTLLFRWIQSIGK